MNDQEGQIAVHMARQTIEAETRDQDMGGINAPGSFKEERGVFVTLSTFPEHRLRGCIGYPEPVFSLAKAILLAAEGACHTSPVPAAEGKGTGRHSGRGQCPHPAGGDQDSGP